MAEESKEPTIEELKQRIEELVTREKQLAAAVRSFVNNKTTTISGNAELIRSGKVDTAAKLDVITNTVGEVTKFARQIVSPEGRDQIIAEWEKTKDPNEILR